jgi:hypothetical protein
MKIEIIDRRNVATIKDRMIGQLKPLMDELGLVFKIGRGNFNANNWSFKAEVSLKDSDGEDWRNTREASDWKHYCYSDGLKPDDLGRQFRCPENGIMTIIGWAAKNRKYPVILLSVDGRRFKYPPVLAKRGLQDAPIEV